jgi:hypothetical protein
MPGQINLQPEVLDLSIYAGDGVTLPMTCVSGAGAPIDLTGAIDAQIRVNRLEQTEAIASFSVNTVDAYEGKIVLTLTGDQTEALMLDPSVQQGKFVGAWDVQWTPAGSEPRTICQGKVECVADVSR